MPRLIGWLLQYVAPLYLLAIFVYWLYSEITKPSEANLLLKTFRDPVAATSLGFLALIIILFLLIIGQSVRRWEAAERSRASGAAPEVQS